MKFDLERFNRSAISIEGVCDTIMRREVIEEALAHINETGLEKFRKGYLGVKNYASFGDQRSDHEYGYGPKHGVIVFSVMLKDRTIQKTNFDDEIYALMAVRDFPNFRTYDKNLRREMPTSLTSLVSRYKVLSKELKDVTDKLTFDVNTENTEEVKV